MPTMLPPADVMTWHRDGYQIVVNEDGPMLRTSQRTFEPGEVAKLIELYQAVAEAAAHGDSFEPPRPPTREQIAAMASDDREQYAARRAMRAIKAEFRQGDAPDIDVVVPF